MTLLRSHKPLPAELNSEQAWIDRLRNEPARVVLADAYEYGLWYFDENGVSTLDERHPLVQRAHTIFLHSSTDAYNEAVIELMRRDRTDPYELLAAEAEAIGVPEEAVRTVRAVATRVADAKRATPRRDLSRT